MNWDFAFFTSSILLGLGLAMDAFSVSLANGLHEPCMQKRRMSLMAGVFAFFQFIMPLIGWFCVHSLMQVFSVFEKYIPWIAVILLVYIGGKMLWEAFFGSDEDEDCTQGKVGISMLLLQGVATSIDALSVGFTIAEYSTRMALVCCVLIAVVTYLICVIGVYLGKKFGTRLSGKASVLGGVILIVIGLKIFLTGIL